MLARLTVLAGSLALAGCASGPRQEARAEAMSESSQVVTCVESWPEVRYGNLGYDHVVHLYSRCEVRAYCEVSSDVNPEPSSVEIAPGEHLEVLTFRGSPARQFTPKVVCRFRT